MSKQNLPFNKANFQVLLQECNMLKITLNFLSIENTKLKSQIEDMKITVKHNKEQLDEYVSQITTKDKMFEKMMNHIEQLTKRLKFQETLNKINNVNVNNIKEKNTHINQTATNATSNVFNSSLVIAKENDNNEEKFKEFFSRQSEIIEEMNVLKDDIQFLMENKSKSKLKERYGNVITSNRSLLSFSNASSNQSVSSVNDSLSMLISSVNSGISTYRNKKVFNINERFNLNKKINQFLSDYNSKKNILLFVDNQQNVWELIERSDLSVDFVKTHSNLVKSILPPGYASKDSKLDYFS